MVALAVKTWITRTLCLSMEYQQRMKLSPKIKDAHGGVVAHCLQILQCERAWMHSHVFLFKQYATRVLLCELNQGVMARQGLKDQFTNLIVLQSFISLHQRYETPTVAPPQPLPNVECESANL